VTKPRTAEQWIDHLRTYVRRDDDCLIWAGALRDGRPAVTYNGQKTNAQRLLLELLGHDLRRKCVWTVCDRLCMNSAHLRAGYRRQHKRATRSSAAHGVHHAMAVALGLRSTGVPLSELARQRGVTYQALWNLLRRWRSHGVIE
jgi:hypothetical protein